MNHQHAIGMDLEGDLGGLFFSSINDLEVQRSRVVANANNQQPQTAQFAVEISDASALEGGTWILQFGDNGSYEVIDQASGEVVNRGRLPSDPEAEINMPGFNIRYEGGSVNAGDKFLIQPTRNAAANIDLEISREEDLALASPIKATTSDDNLGTGVISQGTMLNVRNPLTNTLLPGFTQQQTLANGPLTVSFTEAAGCSELQCHRCPGHGAGYRSLRSGPDQHPPQCRPRRSRLPRLPVRNLRRADAGATPSPSTSIPAACRITGTPSCWRRWELPTP